MKKATFFLALGLMPLLLPFSIYGSDEARQKERESRDREQRRMEVQQRLEEQRKQQISQEIRSAAAQQRERLESRTTAQQSERQREIREYFQNGPATPERATELRHEALQKQIREAREERRAARPETRPSPVFPANSAPKTSPSSK